MGFEFYHKTKIISGNGSIACIGEEVKNSGYNKVFIVTDAFIGNSDVLKKIKTSLEEKEISYIVFDEVLPNPIDSECVRVAQMIKESGADAVIGVGGGSSMDQAKAAAALVTNGGTCKDWDGIFLEQKMHPVICIPTSAGTGSEVTFVAVITDPERKFKMSVFDPEKLIPETAILDPELTLSLPPLMTAATGVDALTHAIEAYTSKLSNELTDGIAIRAMEIIIENLEKAVHSGDDIDARENMLIGSMMAGMAFINSNVGAVHAISETIGAWYGVPHGIANSIFLPHVMRYNISSNIEKYAKIAMILGVDTNGKTKEEISGAGVEKILELNKFVNIPSLRELQVLSEDDFEGIAIASAKNPLSLDNSREIGEEGYIEILKKAYAI